MSCWRYRIVGKVQGVWFRASTRETALKLGLTGEAINLPNGQVEVTACGEPAALRQLADWLRHGPPLARVDRIESEPVDERPFDGFRTG